MELQAGVPRTVLICDHVGLLAPVLGGQNYLEVQRHAETSGAVFWTGACERRDDLDPSRIHFFYQPDLSDENELIRATRDLRYDAVICAATIIPERARFPLGGVRIGTGTGNMRSVSWGGVAGIGGSAPLMNTPGVNSRATAQMVFKAVFSVAPRLSFHDLNYAVLNKGFDTRRHLLEFSTEKLEGKRFAVLGFGNIGREVARIADALRLRVSVYARERDRNVIETLGYEFAASPEAAASGADFLTCHVGLGRFGVGTGSYSNAGFVNGRVLARMNDRACLINFDRGEVVDVLDLQAALDRGKIQHAFIDADIFRDGDGNPSGPLEPYLALARQFPTNVCVLPHAVADTDHPSRVAGAKQAIDQICDAIVNRRLKNHVGQVPPGYTLAPDEAAQHSPV